MKKLLLSHFLFLISILSLPKDLFSQHVGIGTSSPNSSAILDLKSVNSGLLPPRMSAAQRDAIAFPAKGLLVFVNTDSSFYLYDGAWKKLVSSSETWNLDGNTIDSNKYIGSKNSLPVRFKVKGSDKMVLDSNGRLQIFGRFTSLIIGEGAGNNDDYTNRSFFVGYHAGTNNTTGSYNHFSGNYSGEYNTTGSGNHFSGLGTGRSNTTGGYNHCVGMEAGALNTVGSFNFFEGRSAGFSNVAGDSNYYSGHYAGGFALGSNNMAIGLRAGNNLIHGSQNILIGNMADVNADSLTNAIAIGYKSRVAQSNSMVLGGTGAFKVKVGIGTMAPQNTLDVNSGESYSDIATFRSTGGWGQVLVTNGTTITDLGAVGSDGYTGTNSPGHFHIRTGAYPRISIQDVTGNVGIGTMPDPSARLDISSTTGGLLPPRMSAAQRDAIPSPANGLMVFVNDDSSFYFFDGTWKNMIAANDTWSLTGNSIDNNKYIGTQNDMPLRFKVNNTDRMMLDDKGRLKIVGIGPGLIIGNGAGMSITGGMYSFFVGEEAGGSNTTGSYNHFNGNYAGLLNTSGDVNYFSGNYAGLFNTTGSSNHFAGIQAGFHNTTGNTNFCEGFSAGFNNEEGNANYYSGFNAGGMAVGDSNMAIGYTAGVGLVHGSRNTFIGNLADVAADSLSNAAAIGYNAKVSRSNSMVLGGTGTSKINVGIGTTAPQTTLDVTSPGIDRDVATFRSTGGWAQIFVTQGSFTTDLGSHIGGGFVGTHNAGDFQIRTGTLTRMSFQHSTGNVGIGNTSPAEKLDVNGNITLSGRIINQASITTALFPSWTQYSNGYAEGAYYKDKEGRVHLSGTVAYFAGSPVGSTIFNLPAGYRPPSGKFQFVVINNAGFGRIEVLANGNVTVVSGIPGWFSLDGISFRVE